MSAYLYYGIPTSQHAFNGAEADNYPSVNVIHRNQNIVWQPGSVSNTSIHTWNLGEARASNALILINNNLYTELSTGDGIRLLTNSADDGTFGDANDEQHLGTAGPTYVLPSASDEPIWIETFTTSSARQYWRFVMRNYTANSSDSQIGIAMICPRLEVSRHYDRPHTQSRNYGTSTFQTSGGQDWGNLHHDEKRGWILAWSASDEAVATAIIALWDACKGGYDPIIYSEYSDILQTWVHYLVWPLKLTIPEPMTEAHDITLEIEEV